MTTRISNSLFLEVLPPIALEGMGWTVRVLSERDYQTVVADIPYFAGLGFTMDANDVGGGKVTLDAEHPVFTSPLPAGETTKVVDQEALWQIMEDGNVRFEFLAEDVEEDVITDGARETVIAGRGTGSVLEWAPVLPAGMPTPTSMSREFNAHPMAVWFQLFQEAKAAGYLEWVNVTFDASDDSEGNPWGPAQALTVTAGDTLLDLLKRWAEANELSWSMGQGFVLSVRQDPGNHLEDTVVFTQYRSQGEHKRKITRRELANVVYADSGDNGIAVSEDATSATKWRKRAAWVSAGDAGDASARSAVANITLSLAKDQRLSRTISLLPDRDGRHPFVDFTVHDWVGVEVPDDDAESGAVQVKGLAVDIDADGVVQYEATLQSRFEARAVKVQKLLDKLGASERSGSGSAAASPIPVTKAMSVVTMADLADVDLTSPSTGSLLQWNGSRWIDVVGNLDLLADVDVTGAEAPTNGQVLAYDSASGLWKPSSAGGGGGSLSAKQKYPPPVITTSAASAATFCKGARLLAMAQCQVTLVDMEVVGVAGKTYRIACWRTNAATSALEAQIGADVDVASPGTGKQKISTGAVAWDLEAGRTYAFLIRCTDNSAIAVYTGGTAATGSIGTLLAGPPGVNNYVATAAVPAAAVALTSAAGVAECEITAIST